MKLRTVRYLALFLLAMPGAAIANDKWYYRCNKGDCESCQSASCEPTVETYQTENGFDTEEKAREAGEKECKGEADNSYDGGSSSGGAEFTSPGVTDQNYNRSNLNFQDVSPDYAKTESINGVRIPKYLPVKQGGWHINDLPDGFEIAKYPSNGLGAPDGNGIRPVKPGAQASSVTTYRNPDGGKTTSQGNMDVVHKQRHPLTGEWVTRTIRIHAPQGNNNWFTKSYLGDPAQNPTLDPYREITITRTPNPDGTETTREVTKDRDTSGNYVVTSDLTRTYAFYKHGEPAILSEAKHTGTGSDLTTTWTYFHNSADQGSFNKPATMRRSDGQWSNTTYQGNPVTGTLVTKTVSGWLDNVAPAIGTAPDENANRVVTEFEAKNETGTIGREEKVQGVTVSKTWGERYKANSGELIEKSRVETGSATLTTIRTGYPDNDLVSAVERGRLKSIQHPDGTVTLHRHAMQGDNRVETIDTGVGSLSAVTDGTRTVSTYTKDDVLIAQVTSDIASGIELSARQAIVFDSNDKPARWAYDNNLEDYSETINGCCGIDSERTRDGILTTYTRDGLKRPVTAVSQGITLTYTYGKKTINSTDFPSINITATAGNLTLDQGTTVHDHAGNVIQQTTPDLDGNGNEEITTTNHNFTARITTTINPDGGTIVSTDYADGQSKSTTGTAVPDSNQTITVGNNLDSISGAIIKSTITRPSGTAAGDQISTTYQAIGGLTLASQLNGTTTATYDYDNLARPILVADGDGVKQHTAYNSKGEAYRSATSRDGNDTIDFGTDSVSETLTDVADIPGFGPAIRSISKVWTDADITVVTTTTLQSPYGIKSSTTSLGVANPSTSLSAPTTDRADGSWIDTTTAPDGTKTTVTHQNWLTTTQSRIDTAGNVIESTTTDYDALRRPETTTHSRTGLVTTYYAANGQVDQIDDHGRVTSFKYDNMGNRVETTLPDTSKTYTVFSDSGQPIISWGSQTYPTYNTYDEQDRRLTLRTNPTLTTAGVPTDAGGSLTSWIYFANGHLQQKHDDAGKGATYTYTNAGRLHTREWARGVLTTYDYTTAGQLFTVTYSNEPADQSTPNLEFRYDILGRKDTVKRGGVLHADYDYHSDTLALTTEKLNQDTAVARALNRYPDSLGRPLSLEISGEYTTAYGFDSAGRFDRVWNHPTLDANKAPTGNADFTYGYQTNSQHLVHSVTDSTHTVTNTWESTRDVLATKVNEETVGIHSIPSSFAYGVNAIGQRETLGPVLDALNNPVSTYTPKWVWDYNDHGELTEANDQAGTNDRAYQFDAIGNREKTVNDLLGDLPTTNNWTSNALNQYTKANGVPLPTTPAPAPYDFDGNLRFDGGVNKDSENREYQWDAENRLIAVKRTSDNTTLATYAYDHLSRLISRTANGAISHYLYDGWNRIEEFVGTTLQKTYTCGMDFSGSLQGAGGVGGLLSVKSGSALHYPVFDGNGNVSEYLDGNGAFAAHFEYDPFGNTVVNTDTANQFEYRFSTKPQDATTGLYYYGYRYYDPLTGRWPSRDPVKEDGGLNLYSFCQNNAPNSWDKLGLACDAPHQLLCKTSCAKSYPRGTHTRCTGLHICNRMLFYKCTCMCTCHNDSSTIGVGGTKECGYTCGHGSMTFILPPDTPCVKGINMPCAITSKHSVIRIMQ